MGPSKFIPPTTPTGKIVAGKAVAGGQEACLMSLVALWCSTPISQPLTFAAALALLGARSRRMGQAVVVAPASSPGSGSELEPEPQELPSPLCALLVCASSALYISFLVSPHPCCTCPFFPHLFPFSLHYVPSPLHTSPLSAA